MGLRPRPEPTLRRIAYRAWSIFVCFLLLRILFWYHVMSVFLSALSYLTPVGAHKLERICTEFFWRATAFFVRLNNVKVTVTGDPLVPESAVVVCNHQSLVDYFLMVHLAQTTPGLAPEVNFFTWYALWRVPSLRTVLNVALCDENWELSRLLCQTVFQKVVVAEAPQWVVLFPEVNIWTPAAAYLQRLQAQKYYLPYHDHTLYARYPGLLNAVNTLGSRAHIKFLHMYNVTVLFHGAQPPSLLDLFALAEQITVTIDVRVTPLKSVPQKKAKLEKWLEKTWLEKDKRMATMKRDLGMRRPATRPQNPFWDVPVAKLLPPTRLASRG